MLAHFFAYLFAVLSALVPAHTATFTLPPLTIPPRAEVLFGGDMMFDRSIRTTMEKNGGDYLFSCIDDTLRDADLVVANLEGPITDNPSKSVGSTVGGPDNFTFTFPLAVAPLLAAHHIGIVNLGNNHILNFGVAGVRTTEQKLAAAGVASFGSPLTQAYAEASVHGIPLAFINYNEFSDTSTASTTIAQIEEAKNKGEFPVVYTHWGIEYATTSPARVQALAHRFVDAGADLVVGSHPHVVEEHELYRGKYIYYSLGNFIFDQYWDDAVRTGLLLDVTFGVNGVVSVGELPVRLEQDRRTCPRSVFE